MSEFTLNSFQPSDEARNLSQQLRTPSFGSKPEFPSILNGHSVGSNNLNGRPIVRTDGGSNIEVISNNENFVSGQFATVQHDQTAKGSRKVTTQFNTSTITSPGAKPTANSNSTPDIDSCISPNAGDPGEPDEPDEPEPPQPPPAPPESPNDNNNGGGSGGDPPAPQEGCYPESDCQWYNSSDGAQSSCPSGTTYKGFAEMPGGVFKVLCCGENRPPGDGCPEEPGSVGWQCVNGTCEQLPAGLYATKAECEQNCNQDTDTPWAIEDCQCTMVGEGGSYATLEECEAALPPPPFQGGQCPIRYDMRYRVEWGGGFSPSVSPGYYEDAWLSRSIYGPISEVFKRYEPGGVSDTWNWYLSCNDGNGQPIEQLISSRFVSQTDGQGGSIADLQFKPYDPAQQDNCGNLPPDCS